MIYLDSYVFLDLFSGEGNRVEKAKKYIEKAKREGCVISTVVLTEVIYHLIRKGFEDVAEDFLLFIQIFEKMQVVNVNEDIAIQAAKLRSKYYKKHECELSFLDCLHIATAIYANCTEIVTGDEEFLKIKEIKVEIY
ncbi:MAG: PIN domain-containing protein [Thermofilum sp.]|nr:PIN domain-containing protein [Thermofilum sp.]